MTVTELIKELRKYPGNAEVAWRDHDQSENEINSKIHYISSFDWTVSFDPQYCKNVEVVLSP